MKCIIILVTEDRRGTMSLQLANDNDHFEPTAAEARIRRCSHKRSTHVAAAGMAHRPSLRQKIK
jgi:hypothetical protein